MDKNTVSVAFTGDIGFDKYMSGRWKDPDFLDEKLLQFFRSADHVEANVEGAMTRAPEVGNKGRFFHAMDPDCAVFLKNIGADIWNIGNNHTLDAGAQGVADTMMYAAKNGAVTVGAGLNIEEASRPVFLEGAGGIGIISVTYMNENTPAGEDSPGIFSWKDMDLIARRISEIRERCRWCVVVSHGGEEFSTLPSVYIRERYIKYLEMGADAVIGHHPHVPQNYEIFGGAKPVFYSLGNFIFDTDYQRVHDHTDQGLLVKLIFTEDSLSFELQGTKIVRGEERVIAAPLADIVTEVPAEQYQLLAPLEAKAHLAEERRRRKFMDPERFRAMGDKEWVDFLTHKENWDNRDDYGYQDFEFLYHFSFKADEGRWKESSMEKVKDYILALIPEEDRP